MSARNRKQQLIWLAAAIVTGGVAALWLSAGLPWPRCMFRALLGMPCPTCGSTRALLALMHGDVLASWRFNPLVLLGLSGMATLVGHSLMSALRHPPAPRDAGG